MTTERAHIVWIGEKKAERPNVIKISADKDSFTLTVYDGAGKTLHTHRSDPMSGGVYLQVIATVESIAVKVPT